jgi:hypothetical protein
MSRLSTRNVLDRPATLCLGSEPTYHPILLADLSLTGARIRVSSQVRASVGDCLKIYWTPLHGVPPLELQAKVVRILDHSPGLSDWGLSFFELAPRLEKILTQWLRSEVAEAQSSSK